MGIYHAICGRYGATCVSHAICDRSHFGSGLSRGPPVVRVSGVPGTSGLMVDSQEFFTDLALR
eukprot:2414214-Heterocapsa_arctica.AAC.1